MATIVIPAHNESAVIEACLDAVLADAQDGELEVIVACNGCTDDTALKAQQWAASGRGRAVNVIDIDAASKTAALNAAITASTPGPIVFVDADVQVETETVRRLIEALAEPSVLAASTGIALDESGASVISRSYHRFWIRLPSIVHGLAGRGVYALSSGGVERLGRFPEIVADDRYVDLIFGVDERTVISETSQFTISRTVAELVARKTRVFAGNSEVGREVAAPTARPDGGVATVVKSDPRTLIHLPAYLLVNGLAKLKAKRAVRSGAISWNRDEGVRGRS